MRFLFKIDYSFIPRLLLFFMTSSVTRFAQAEFEVPSQFMSPYASVILGLSDLENLTDREVRSAARALFHKYNPDRFRSPPYSQADKDRASEVMRKIQLARDTLLAQKLNPFWRQITTEGQSETIAPKYPPSSGFLDGKANSTSKNRNPLRVGGGELRVLEYAVRSDSALFGSAEKRTFETALNLALSASPGNFIAVPASGDRLDLLIDVTDSERNSSTIESSLRLGGNFYESEPQSLISFLTGGETIVLRLFWDRLNLERRGSRMLVRPNAFLRTAAILAHEIHGRLGSMIEISKGGFKAIDVSEFRGLDRFEFEIRAYEAGVKALDGMRQVVSRIPDEKIRRKLQSDLEMAVGREKIGLSFWRQERAQFLSAKSINDARKSSLKDSLNLCRFFE